MSIRRPFLRLVAQHTLPRERKDDISEEVGLNSRSFLSPFLLRPSPVCPTSSSPFPCSPAQHFMTRGIKTFSEEEEGKTFGLRCDPKCWLEARGRRRKGTLDLESRSTGKVICSKLHIRYVKVLAQNFIFAKKLDCVRLGIADSLPSLLARRSGHISM